MNDMPGIHTLPDHRVDHDTSGDASRFQTVADLVAWQRALEHAQQPDLGRWFGPCDLGKSGKALIASLAGYSGAKMAAYGVAYRLQQAAPEMANSCKNPKEVSLTQRAHEPGETSSAVSERIGTPSTVAGQGIVAKKSFLSSVDDMSSSPPVDTVSVGVNDPVPAVSVPSGTGDRAASLQILARSLGQIVNPDQSQAEVVSVSGANITFSPVEIDDPSLHSLEAAEPQRPLTGQATITSGSQTAAVRVHAEWTPQGVRVWLGVDADQANNVQELGDEVRQWIEGQSEHLLSLVCNGRVVLQAISQPPSEAGGKSKESFRPTGSGRDRSMQDDAYALTSIFQTTQEIK